MSQFGEPYAQAGTTDLSFTGQNQDTVGALYDFLFREYSIQGRWPSPDPAGLAAVDLSDPQSLNRYAYVRNSPTSLIDPLGLDDCSLGSDGVIHCTVTASPPPPSPLDLLLELACDNLAGFGVPSCFTSTDVRSLGNWRQALRERRQERQEQKGVEPHTPRPTSSLGVFTKNFFKNFSLQSVRLPGETVSACVARVQNGLLGKTGADILGAASGASFFTSVLTTPVGGLASAGPVSGTNIIATRVGTSVVDLAVKDAVAQGTLSAETASTVSAGSAAVSKVAVPAFAVTVGLEGGFFAACR